MQNFVTGSYHPYNLHVDVVTPATTATGGGDVDIDVDLSSATFATVVSKQVWYWSYIYMEL